MKQEDFNTSIKYTMNLTVGMVDNLIEKTESVILETKKQQSELDEKVKKAKADYEELLAQAKAEYEPVQLEWDRLQQRVNEEQSILDALVRFKTSSGTKKEIKVYSTISNTNHKIKKERRSLGWNKKVYQYLKLKNEFVDIRHIIDRVVAADPTLQSMNLPEADKKKAQYNLHSSALKGMYHFCMFQGKVGLEEWIVATAGEVTPKPAFLKHFMS